MAFSHGYPFDPTYGYDLEQLLGIEPPPEPAGFGDFWQQRYQRAALVDPQPQLIASGREYGPWRIKELTYHSTEGAVIGGWVLVPHGVPRRGFVVGHGYGGRGGPDLDLPFPDAVLLFPCFRGLGRSRSARWPQQPERHVLHGIESRHHYLVGGCVDDLWLAVTVLLQLFPALADHIGYLGISFGGGVGALALPWEPRVTRAHFNVPTFGHQPLRLTLPTLGSGDAVARYWRDHRHVADTLSYYDAAIAARYLRKPLHLACALFDPVVAPPGQFAIYNGLPGPKTLFLLDAGHFDYPARAAQDAALKRELKPFFETL